MNKWFIYGATTLFLVIIAANVGLKAYALYQDNLNREKQLKTNLILDWGNLKNGFSINGGETLNIEAKVYPAPAVREVVLTALLPGEKDWTAPTGTTPVNGICYLQWKVPTGYNGELKMFINIRGWNSENDHNGAGGIRIGTIKP
jgi:hypothetical protein